MDRGRDDEDQRSPTSITPADRDLHPTGVGHRSPYQPPASAGGLGLAAEADHLVARIADAGPGPVASEFNDWMGQRGSGEVARSLEALLDRLPPKDVAHVVAQMGREPRFDAGRRADAFAEMDSAAARDAIYWDLDAEVAGDVMTRLVDRGHEAVAVGLLRRDGRTPGPRGRLHDLRHVGRSPSPGQQEADALARLDDLTAARLLERWWTEQLGDRARPRMLSARDRIAHALQPEPAPDGRTAPRPPLRGPDRLLARMHPQRRAEILAAVRARAGYSPGDTWDGARRVEMTPRVPGAIWEADRGAATRLLGVGSIRAAAALATPLREGDLSVAELKRLAARIARSASDAQVVELFGPEMAAGRSPQWLREEAVRRVTDRSAAQIREHLGPDLHRHAAAAVRQLESIAARDPGYAARVVADLGVDLAESLLRGVPRGGQRLSDRAAGLIIERLSVRRAAEAAARLERVDPARWQVLRQEIAARNPKRAAVIDNRKRLVADKPEIGGWRFFGGRMRQHWIDGRRTRLRQAAAYGVVSTSALGGSLMTALASGGSAGAWLLAAAPVNMGSQLLGAATVHGAYEPWINKRVLSSRVPAFGGTRLGDSPEGRMITVNTGWGGQNFVMNGLAALVAGARG